MKIIIHFVGGTQKILEFSSRETGDKFWDGLNDTGVESQRVDFHKDKSALTIFNKNMAFAEYFSE